ERRRVVAERDELRATLARVWVLHTQHPDPCDCIWRMLGGACFKSGACDVCRHPWPCPTIAALAAPEPAADLLTVCIAHGRFLPCRKDGAHNETTNPFWVKSVRDFQDSTIPGLTWEPTHPEPAADAGTRDATTEA